MIFRRKKFTHKSREIAPDEIFLDSSNLPEFDTNQFEGQIEKPISYSTIFVVAIFFASVGILFTWRIGNLQISLGDKYRNISENNRLHHSLVFAERGAITDRNNTLLAWNTIDPVQTEFSLRSYAEDVGIHNLVGYVKYPKKDKFGFYYNTEYSGADGVEKYYDKALTGFNGLKITETDALGKTLSQSTVRPAKKGENLQLSIDVDVQKAMYLSIQEMARRSGFRGGAAVVMDVHTGEVLTSVSYPEYDSNVMTSGQDSAKIKSYLTDTDNPFLDRVASGLYTPGSILKPFFAFGALAEGVISPEKQIESRGELKVPNPYRPGEFSIFKDWKAHGFTDMRRAIAVSSDVYFYQIGGGYPGQKGLGIDNIDKYAKMFGYGADIPNNFFSGRKGVIPDPEWKKINFKGDIWRLGDTYNTTIGQYGFQVTPIQAVRSVAAVANNGTLPMPTIISEKTLTNLKSKDLTTSDTAHVLIPIASNPSARGWFKIIQEGMRETVTEGTMQQLNVPFVKVAGKTGTAQLGISKKRINSWAVGFFPYEKPKYAFVVLLENGPNLATIGATAAVQEWLNWINVYKPQYLNNL